MSIIITNITEKETNRKYGAGPQRYLLRINNKVICKFEHIFEEGLSVCLQKAAEAVKTQEARDIHALLLHTRSD